MSVEAVTWALGQPITHSSAKFVLVVLANCASADTMMAFPSSTYLSSATGQDRKTVLANLVRLREWGLIEDTGHRRGETKQIVVYRLMVDGDLFSNTPKSGTVPKTELSQKRNSSENGGKESRFSAKQSQKRDTERSEPKGNRQIEIARALKDAKIPDDVWREWSAYRSSVKGWTSKARELSLCTLRELVAEGHDPRKVVEQSIECGWSGLFAPRAKSVPNAKQSAPPTNAPPLWKKPAAATPEESYTAEREMLEGLIERDAISEDEFRDRLAQAAQRRDSAQARAGPTSP